jgi:hypothetical protein
VVREVALDAERSGHKRNAPITSKEILQIMIVVDVETDRSRCRNRRPRLLAA